MDGTWFEELSGVAFSRSRLSYGVFARAGERARVGARVGEVVLDLAAALGDDIFDAPSMKGFLARAAPAGRAPHRRSRRRCPLPTGATSCTGSSSGSARSR